VTTGIDRLITVSASHYCEKARWALDRRGVPYREEAHVPLLSWVATFGSGGRRTVPVLVTASGVLSDSTDIAAYADRVGSAGDRLVPDDADLAEEVRDLEDLFDEKLGPATRRLGYHMLLRDREALLRLWTASAPSVERGLARVMYPMLRQAVVRGLVVDEAGVARSRERLADCFDVVHRRIASGRRYLVGDRFTLADLTFASLAAPVLLPETYAGALPRWSAMSGEAQASMLPWREHPAGRFALRLFETERRRAAH
jgi:glutathione S-transferase